MDKPNFYAIIPATVRYDKNLTAFAKLLYAEISSLSNKEGYCWASNSYFAEVFEVDERSIRRTLNNLEEHGYIEVSVSEDNRSRKINIIVGGQKCPPRADKNVPLNNTSNNNIKVFNKLNTMEELIEDTTIPVSATKQNQRTNTAPPADKPKKKNVYEKCCDMIDDMLSEEVRDVAREYLKYRLEVGRDNGKPLYANMFKGMLNSLLRLSEEPQEQQQIVSNSLQGGWLKFYALQKPTTRGKIYTDNMSHDTRTIEDVEFRVSSVGF